MRNKEERLKTCVDKRNNVPECKLYGGFNIEELRIENENLKNDNKKLENDWEVEEKELMEELANLQKEVENIPENYNSVCGEGTSLRIIDGKSYCVD